MARRPKLDRFTRIAQQIVASPDAYGLLVRQAAQRHLDDLQHGAARGLVWRPDKAQDVIDFIPDCLYLPDVDAERDANGHADDAEPLPGVPFQLLDYEVFIAGMLYGWYRADGCLRFNIAFFLGSKGCGKTPFFVACMLYSFVVLSGRGTTGFYAGATLDQARIGFVDAKNMVKASPELAAMFDIGENNLAILSRGSFLRPVSAERRGLDGKRVAMAMVDELHEHRNADVIDKIRAGVKGRKNAIIFVPTNAGFDRSSVCWQYAEYSRSVLENTVTNDAWFAFITHMDACAEHRAAGHVYPVAGCEHCDRWDVEGPHWRKANPGLGVTIQMSYLRDQVREAIGMPAKANVVRRLNFSEWTESSVSVISADAWKACQRPIDWTTYKGRPAFVGLDLASTRDIAAVVWVFPEDDGGYTLRPRLYTPKATAAKRGERDRAPYLDWIRDGHLIGTDGSVIDFNHIRKDINDDGDLYRVREIGYDPWSALQMSTDLTDEGFSVCEVRQGFRSMSEPTKRFLDLIAETKIYHDGNIALAWMARNLTVRVDANGNQCPDKSTRGSKIDGVVAAIIGLSRAIVQAAKPFRSVYEDRGFISFEL